MLSVEDRLEVTLKIGGMVEPCVILRADQDIVTISEVFDAVENFTDDNIKVFLDEKVEIVLPKQYKGRQIFGGSIVDVECNPVIFGVQLI